MESGHPPLCPLSISLTLLFSSLLCFSQACIENHRGLKSFSWQVIFLFFEEPFIIYMIHRPYNTQQYTEDKAVNVKKDPGSSLLFSLHNIETCNLSLVNRVSIFYCEQNIPVIAHIYCICLAELPFPEWVNLYTYHVKRNLST